MAPPVDIESEQPCDSCGEPATMQCSRCRDAIYCNATCQKAQWRQHKRTCNQVNLERTIHRAGALLQKLFYIWREKAWNENIESVEDTGKRLLIEPSAHEPGTFYRFPEHLVRNEEEKQMVLAASMSSDFVAFFSEIVCRLIKGFPITVEVVTLKIKIPAKMALLSVAEAQFNTLPYIPHNVFRVTATSTSKQWYFDATGAQFKLFAACSEAKDYMDKYCHGLRTVTPSGTYKMLYDKLCNLPGLSGNLIRQRRDGVRAIEKSLDEWQTETDNTLAQLLRQTDKDFTLSEQGLLLAVTKRVEQYVTSSDFKACLIMKMGKTARMEEFQKYTRVLIENERYLEQYDVDGI